MKSLLFSICILTFLCFCNKTSDQRNITVLSEDQMVKVLIGIHITEAKISNAYLQGDSNRLYYKTLEDSVFIKNGTTKDDFNESYIHYMKEIVVMDKIYSRVVDSLSLREAMKNISY